jgi:hypothetical protein
MFIKLRFRIVFTPIAPSNKKHPSLTSVLKITIMVLKKNLNNK